MQEGPSTIALEEVPYVGSQTPPPTGGLIPETAADAKEQQQITEGEEAPVSNFYRSNIPRVTHWSFGIRRSPGPRGSEMATEYPAQVVRGSRTTSGGFASSWSNGKAMVLHPGTEH